MQTHTRRPRYSHSSLFLASLCLSASLCDAQSATTAWHAGAFHIDPQSVVESSDVVLQRPNTSPKEAMPLGNGRLGLGVWAEDGYTAQLNRGDTFPHRLSAGQVVLPGLKQITQAPDYSARLDLYNGEFEEKGGKMSATTYVMQAQDAVAIDVRGADPSKPQTAILKLWSPRKPQAVTQARVGSFSETWKDESEAGATHETFGSLAAITADAENVQVKQLDAVSIQVTFQPHADGTFRVLVGVPSWRGGDAQTKSSSVLAAARKLPFDEHRAAWHKYWDSVGLIHLTSANHSAEYFENLRTLDLFTTAAESRDRIPGGQAGIGDLFSPIRDEHQWGPSAYWHWNLRMQVSANLGAGAFELNQPYFRLYRDNLDNLLAWTKKHMGNRPGICVPETMRFNGAGYENETWTPGPATNCGEDFHPYYNARTISTGAEVSFWIWQQYLYTNDLAFLKTNYPIMRESARFLLSYGKLGPDGFFHTFPSNSHETEWDVHDPTTDVVAMRTLFPEVVEAASLLHEDADLIAKLKETIPHLEEFPVVSLSAPKKLLPLDSKQDDTIIIASREPDAPQHNVENIGLEPVWPYGLINDDGPLHALAVRTFMHRPSKNEADWSADPEQAAHLGLADEMKSSLAAITERYQIFPSGMATLVGPELYVEQMGVTADALQSALVQDSGDLVRIASAWPKDWNADGTVFIRHRGKVHVQIRNGSVTTVGIETGADRSLRVRNPWPGVAVEVVNGRTGAAVHAESNNNLLAFAAHAGGVYLIQTVVQKQTPLPFQTVSATQAAAPKKLGSRSIGLTK